MDNVSKKAGQRLGQIGSALGIGTAMSSSGTSSIPWDPDSTSFPTRKQLPKIQGAPDQAAWVWGEDDALGRLNLLTPARVAAAAKEIQTGEIVPVNLPLQHPDPPMFHREIFKHEIKTLAPEVAFDDLYTLNTQSGTQWDGFRHCAVGETKQFYNGVTADDIVGSKANHRNGVHHWAEHGIAGRGVLLDFCAWASKTGVTYDANDNYAISYDQLVACGKRQGIDIRPAAQGGDIRPGDIIFIRTGWVRAYAEMSSQERQRLAARTPAGRGSEQIRYVGVLQDDAMLDWLHDCYFSCVAGDAPAFEAWPSRQGFYLHEYILPRWGMPLGEMLDLERLSQTCASRKRWTFFFSSVPANCIGGVGSHVNGQAIF